MYGLPKSLALCSLAAATALVLGTATADAKCTRLGYSVNDYGKVGPARDAKALLDKYIARWTAERGIKRYTVGKKDVKCELFIDLIIFDEYTCTATAPVCWTEGPRRRPGAAGRATSSNTGSTATLSGASGQVR